VLFPKGNIVSNAKKKKDSSVLLIDIKGRRQRQSESLGRGLQDWSQKKLRRKHICIHVLD
jgi:hypothetical protein